MAEQTLKQWRQTLKKTERAFLRDLATEARKITRARVTREMGEVPRDTGQLRRSIKISIKQIKGSRDTLRISISSGVPWAWRATKFFSEIAEEVAQDLRTSRVLDMVLSKQKSGV